MIVTLFKDIQTTDAPFYREVESVLTRIKDGVSKSIVLAIRELDDKSERDKIKKQLPAICFSGQFSTRNDDSITEHSGLICLDFDGYKTEKDLIEHRLKIIKSDYTMAAFVSPSGNGLKVLVKIPKDIEDHKLYFNALEKYFKSEHFDTTSKNISRVCYESYDPNLYYNKKSLLWTQKDERIPKEVIKGISRRTIIITDAARTEDILMKWWTQKYGLVEGERNNNLYILAAAFNDFGVDESRAQQIARDFVHDGFSESEIQATIRSAYKHTSKFGTKNFQDEEKVLAIREHIKQGRPKKEIMAQLKDMGVDDITAEAVIDEQESEQANTVFWFKDDKGRVGLSHFRLKRFLQEHGFFKYMPKGANVFTLIRKDRNLIDEVTKDDIKDFVLGYIEHDIQDEAVFNYFAERTKIFKEDFLSMLDTISLQFVEDDKHTSYFFYNNCALRVTVDNVEICDYIDLAGYVWRRHQIDRDYISCPKGVCDYEKFIRNISANDKSRILTMETTIGYLLHSYKNPSESPAVILNDESITDTPEGGTGKGLTVKGISHIRNLHIEDGKLFKDTNNFMFQSITSDTQIISFDDISKRFDFEKLFSIMTEGITVEKKYRDAIKIPFDKSPKIVITTNYAIKGRGSSFNRRKWDVELYRHYNEDFNPGDDFKRQMFIDWGPDDWCKFDAYMISNLQKYLKYGLHKSDFVNLEIRNLASNSCHEFIEWCGLTEGSTRADEIGFNIRIYKSSLYNGFVESYPDFQKLSRAKFSNWMKMYAEYVTGKKPEEDRDHIGRYIIIKRKK